MELHHIGIAVYSIDKYYNEILKPYFGFDTISDTVVNYSQNVKIAFVKNSMSATIELIEPIDNNSPIYNILKRNMGGLYHLGFISSNFNDDIKKLRNNKFFLVSNKEGVAFLASPSMEIYELIDDSSWIENKLQISTTAIKSDMGE